MTTSSSPLNFNNFVLSPLASTFQLWSASLKTKSTAFSSPSFWTVSYTHLDVYKRQIVGISLDKDKAKWQKAIADDHLTWAHVSDLKYWDSEIPALYGVRGIPANVLLDPNGVDVYKRQCLDHWISFTMKPTFFVVFSSALFAYNNPCLLYTSCRD